jgi:hypothetical protein
MKKNKKKIEKKNNRRNFSWNATGLGVLLHAAV